MQLNSRLIILVKAPGNSVIYVTFLKPYFCAMLCVYAFKQLLGENKFDYHLSAQN